MDPEGSDIMRAVLDTVDRFASSRIAGDIRDRDRYPHADYARYALEGAADAGLLLATVPEALGGTGMPPSAWARILERVAYVDAGFATSLMAHAMALQAILHHADEEVIGGLLEKAPLAYPLYHQAGDRERLPRISAHGPVGSEMEGTAEMTANAPVAQAAVIIALKDGIPCLCLLHLPVARRPEPIETLGLRSCPVGNILLDETDPEDVSVLAEGGEAIRHLHAGFYSSAVAILLATLKASLDHAIAFGLERRQGGQPIVDHSQLRSMYAQMEVEYRSLRMAWLGAVERDVPEESRLALKILAAQHAVRATIDGVQLLGGYGYTREYPQERRMRDARQASELLGSPSRQRLNLIGSRLAALR